MLLVAVAFTGRAETLWTIGQPDGSPIEFAPGARDQLTYTVGQSVVSRDFAGQHPGSVGFDGRVAERPYTIQFALADVPSGAYALVLDLIYRSGAPASIQVSVNDRHGIFPTEPAFKPSSDGEEANAMLLAGQRLVVNMPASWLKSGDNRITLAPLGLGRLDYDAITFQRGDAPSAKALPALEPTVFYRKRSGRQVELARLRIPFQEKIQAGEATIILSGSEQRVTFTSGDHDFGVLTLPVDVKVKVPDAPVPATLRVKLNDDQALEVTRPFTPAKQWKVYICPKVHNDVGYTDLQPHVNELDNRNTDTALEIMEAYPFYKFNFETSWLVENYLDCRPPRYQQQFFDHARKGQATINAFYLNLMTGICTGEELYRAMYYTHALHRKVKSNFDFACLTDAPSHSWFLPTLLRDVGIKAFSNGSNQTRSPILHFSQLNEDSPFYWEGMNGDRIFMWYARSYTQWKRLTGPDFIGGYASFDYLRISVPQFLVRFLRDDYAPDAVMIYGAYVDNAAIPATGEAELIEQWNREFAFPRLVVASDAEYFDYIESEFGDQLPVYRGDAGAYWEDGVASSAQATTLNREAHEILPQAESLASLATIFDEHNRYPAEDFRGAWRNVLFYDEHTWGAHNSVSQPDREFVRRQWEVKESYATRANLDARNLLARAFNRLCQNMDVHGDTVFAFNLQNHVRTAPLEIEIDRGRTLVDLATDQPVPLDVLWARDGFRRVRFLAQDVPAFGYRGYVLKGLEPVAEAPSRDLSGDTIESTFYRLRIDPETGGIASLFDKRAGRELADGAAPHRLNQYLYVTGGEGSLILNHTFGTPPAQLTIHGPDTIRIVEHVRTPFGQRLIVEGAATNTPSLRSEYVVYDRIPRVDIINTVDKVETRAKEAVYFAFPFAARQPAFECQIQNGWVRPNDDQLPGACREWFTPQNVVHLRDGNFSVAWATPDAPLVTLTDINRGLWPSRLEISNGHLFSYAMHNYWFTNYRARQGGRFVFRYAIASGRDLDPTALARFDADTRSPVLAYPFVSSFSALVGGEGRPLSAASGSFLTLEDPNLQIVTLKLAEDHDGYILRLREVGGQAGEGRLQLNHLRLRGAHLCNGVEEPRQRLRTDAGSVGIPYTPHRYLTVRLDLSSAL